jgi:hypothetical protein
LCKVKPILPNPPQKTESPTGGVGSANRKHIILAPRRKVAKMKEKKDLSLSALASLRENE